MPARPNYLPSTIPKPIQLRVLLLTRGTYCLGALPQFHLLLLRLTPLFGDFSSTSHHFGVLPLAALATLCFRVLKALPSSSSSAEYPVSLHRCFRVLFPRPPLTTSEFFRSVPATVLSRIVFYNLFFPSNSVIYCSHFVWLCSCLSTLFLSVFFVILFTLILFILLYTEGNCHYYFCLLLYSLF